MLREQKRPRSRGLDSRPEFLGRKRLFENRTDVEEHIDKTLKENKKLREYLKDNPDARDLVYGALRKQYETDSSYLRGAELIDDFDFATSSASLVGEVLTPGLGTAVSASEEVFEVIPKVFYSAYYALKSGDYMAPFYHAARELISFIPYVGDLVDLERSYTKRANKRFRKRAAKSLLERIVSGDEIKERKTVREKKKDGLPSPSFKPEFSPA